tara:strand:- start:8080 stop:8952 length:873 start_codon:yes stop_codon:yes gene_type:complete
MGRQYKRKYVLNITTSEGRSREISELRFVFEITKSVLSFPNLCKFTIFNPNAETISMLQKKFTKVEVNVGYEGNIRLLFKGEVRNINQTKIGPDRTIIVYAGDGERDWQNAIFNKTFKESVTIKNIVNEVMTSFKDLTVGIIDGIPDTANKLRGQTISGSSKDILDEYAKEYNLDWNIQDGEIIISPINTPISNSEAILITSATGMIGSPTVTEIGVDITTLLNPSLLPNRAFTVESIFADVQLGNLFFRSRDTVRTTGEGNYKIQEVLFKGDTHAQDWISKVKGRIINA